MVTAQRQENRPDTPRVVVSNTAANMISSLHPDNTSKANAAREKVKLSVLDQTKAKKIIGVDNAFVVRADDLRVIFKKEGDSVVITSIISQA